MSEGFPCAVLHSWVEGGRVIGVILYYNPNFLKVMVRKGKRQRHLSALRQPKKQEMSAIQEKEELCDEEVNEKAEFYFADMMEANADVFEKRMESLIQ